MSVSPPQPARGPDGAFSEDRADARRYFEAVRRRWPLIVGMAILVTLGVLALSLLLPKTYEATARIVLEDAGSALGSSDADSVRRRLATADLLLTSPRVLEAAARRVPGESKVSVREKVTSQVDPEANIIEVTADDRRSDRAAGIANAVAQAFIETRTSLERSRLSRARQGLAGELARLRRSSASSAEAAAIQDRISELGVSEASAGSELQVAEEAEVPTSPSSPRPVRNALLALLATLFLGVLLALGRDQLVPRVGGPRELSRLTNLPVLASIPYVRSRMGRRRRLLTGVEDEAYQTLRTRLTFALPPTEQRIILVTSAVHAEGKSTVVSRLGRALAQGGHRTLLIAADLRHPTLHESFGLPSKAGVADALGVLDHSPEEFDRSMLSDVTLEVAPEGYRGGGPANLHLLPSGEKPSDPGQLFSSTAAETFFREVRQLDYTYVLVDGAPLLGIADSQVLAQHVDEVLAVARLDRVTVENVVDFREILGRLGATLRGFVVIGARTEASPYYLSGRPTIIQEATPARR